MAGAAPASVASGAAAPASPRAWLASAGSGVASGSGLWLSACSSGFRLDLARFLVWAGFGSSAGFGFWLSFTRILLGFQLDFGLISVGFGLISVGFGLAWA